MATLNPALKSFWKTKADTKVLKGGRASTKTWDTAGFAIFLASKYTVKFLCMRKFQNKIKESVYAILKLRIEEFGILAQGFTSGKHCKKVCQPVTIRANQC